MKKYIFTILLAFLTATTQGQSNQRLHQLEQFFQQQGISVSHKQTNAIDGSITHLMHAYPSLVNLHATSFPQDMSEEVKQKLIREAWIPSVIPWLSLVKTIRSVLRATTTL